MAELLAGSMARRMRLLAPLCVGAFSLWAFTAGAWAQEASASLRACAAESDPARRLACYDRQMGRTSPPARQQPAAAAPSAPTHGPASTPKQSAHLGNQPGASRQPGSRESPAPRHKSPWKLFAGSGPTRLSARVARLDRWPDAMVLHLDNGQVWRQVGRASGDLSLRAGDSVTIEKHLGSYWLSSRYVSNMQVRQEPH
jgi:hypothetical protein